MLSNIQRSDKVQVGNRFQNLNHFKYVGTRNHESRNVLTKEAKNENLEGENFRC